MINNYFLKIDNDSRMMVLWNLERYSNLEADNPYYHFVFKFVNKFVPFTTSNDRYMFLHHTMGNYLIIFHQNTFYSVYRVRVPEAVTDFNDIVITDGQNGNNPTIKIDDLKFSLRFDHDYYEVYLDKVN